MKKKKRKFLQILISISVLLLLGLTACSKDDDPTPNPLLGTRWMETVGDSTYWFLFRESVCDYTVTPKDGNPYNTLWRSYDYLLDKNKQMQLYKFEGSDPKTGYANKKIFWSGKLTNNILSLESENRSLELTQSKL